jgi:hypothetical protein
MIYIVVAVLVVYLILTTNYSRQKVVLSIFDPIFVLNSIILEYAVIQGAFLFICFVFYCL